LSPEERVALLKERISRKDQGVFPDLKLLVRENPAQLLEISKKVPPEIKTIHDRMRREELQRMIRDLRRNTGVVVELPERHIRTKDRLWGIFVSKVILIKKSFLRGILNFVSRE